MTIKERLEKLKQDNYYVIHKAFGEMKMEDGFDLVRIWDEKRRDKCIVIVDKVNEIPDTLLNLDMTKEEVWSLGLCELALDLFVKED